MNRRFKKSIALFVTLGLLFSLLQVGHASVASAATELTNDNIPVGEYEVDFTFLKDGTQEESIAATYMKVEGSKGKLIVEEDRSIWFEHEISASNYGWFEYLGYRPDGVEKADPGVSMDGYEEAAELPGSDGSKVAVRYAINDIEVDQDLLTHIRIPDIGYDHWYNIQLSINTSGIEPEAPGGGVDKTALTDTIAGANALLGSVQAGTEAGQYPQAAKDALAAAIATAQTLSGDESGTQQKVDDAVTALKGAMETLKFAVIPGQSASELYYSMLHSTKAEFSGADGYLKKPASAVDIGGGQHSVTLTVYQSSLIPDFKVEYDSVLGSVYNVSEDKEADTRTVRFLVKDPAQPVNAKLKVSVPTGNGAYHSEYDIRLNLNGVNNVALSGLVSSATSLNRGAQAGTAAGQYPQAAKDTFAAAIAAASAVAANGAGTQAQTDAALTALQAAVEAFKAAVNKGGTGGGGSGTTDGYYFIDYTILVNGKNEASIADGYVVKPALLRIQGSSKTVSFTVLRSKEVNTITINGNSGSVVSQNTAKNTRVVSYPVSDLSGKLNATVRIDWDAVDYHHTYPIQFSFDESTMTPAGDNPAVPGSDNDGNVGAPNLPNPSGGDKEEGEETGEEGASGNGSGSTGGGTGSGSGSGNVGFSDTKNHWAANQISRAVELGIVKGFDDGSFRPNAVVSRGEFIAMISRALKLTNTGAATSFTDAGRIPAWAKEHALLAEQAGLIGGFDDGSFRSGAEISRAQLAVIVTRAAKLALSDASKLTFSDAGKIPAWAGQEIAAAVEAGLITGKVNNKFDPEAPATRAEALTMIIRLLDYLVKQEPKS